MRRLIYAAALVCALFVSSAAQVTVSPFLNPRTQFLDSTGRPLSGGMVFTYAAGTSTPQATYVDNTGTIQNSNPIFLDSAGSANIWLGVNPYKICVQTAGGVQQWCVDSVPGSGSPSILVSITTTAGPNLLNGNFAITQNALATSGANQSSFNQCLAASFWNGAGSQTDQWCWQDVLGSGANPTSTLTLSHSGSPGTAVVNLAALSLVSSGALIFGAITSTGPITGVTGNMQTLGSEAYADQFAGGDCGAKINTCFAANSVCKVNHACGQAWTTAVTIPAASTLQFIQGGIYTTTAAVTLSGIGSAMLGMPFGTGTSGPCSASIGSCLQEATGANLPALVVISGSNFEIRNMIFDGNHTNNPTGGIGIKINTSGSGVVSHTFSGFAGSHGVEVISTGTSNQSCCSQFINDNFSGNGGDGLYILKTGDTFVEAGTQIENNGIKATVNTDGSGVATRTAGTAWSTDSSLVGTLVWINLIPCTVSAVTSTTFSTSHCRSSVAGLVGATVLWGGGIEMSDASGTRIQNGDLGGNFGFGIAGYGTTGGLSSAISFIDGNQFGNQYGNDIVMLGDGPGDDQTFTAGNERITGNTFIGKNPAGTTSIWDAIAMRDTQYDIISANQFNSAGGIKTKDFIEFTEHTASVVTQETIGPNAFQFGQLSNVYVDCSTLANSGANCQMVPLAWGGSATPFEQTQTVAGTGGTCPTAASIGATCSVTVTWPQAFADTNYRYWCQGLGSNAGVPVLGAGSTVGSAASITQTTVATTAVAADFTTIICYARHN